MGWAGVGLDRHIEAERATRAAVETAHQRDDQYVTVHDNHRCAPSTVVAAAALAGSNQMLGLLAGLKQQRQGRGPDLSQQLAGKLDVIEDRLRDGKAVSAGQLQQLQDALHVNGQLDADASSTTDSEFLNMLRMAGFKGRSPATVVAPGQSAHEHAQAMSDLVRELAPGEMVGLMVPSPTRADGFHAVLLGRANDGSLFMYDSAAPDPKNCLYQWQADAGESQQVLALLKKTVRVLGVTPASPRGFIFSAAPHALG